jgi:hypothetical protein
MKKLFFLLISFVASLCCQGQNIGINTTTPVSAMHICAPDANGLVVENLSPLAIGTTAGMYFANGIEGGSPYKYTGAIKTIGESSSSARLAFFTAASSSQNWLNERMSISNIGNVGIGTANPICRLDILGAVRIASYLGIGTPNNAIYPLDVQGNTRISGNVGISTSPSGYSLDVVGSVRLQDDIRIDGILNPNNELNIGNAVHIESGLTVYNGKGIVRSTSATQMKIKRTSVFFTIAAFAPGQTLTSGNMGFGEDFTSVTVTVGQSFNGTGDWAKVLIVPFNVDLVNNTCQFRATNVSNSTIDFSGNWEIVLIGN